MSLIFNRKPETEKLIEFLGAAEPGEEFTYEGLQKLLGSPNRDVRSRITSARNFLEKHRGIVFGAIRGVGLRRMTGDEIAEGGLSILKGISRRTRKGARRNGIVKAPSPSARNTMAITGAIFSKIAQETETNSVRAKIEIARIDGAEAVANIMKARA